ncbi:MAG TPA: CHAT domain-containing protein [Saprospiraceae bacterium]|nr:CHAT domain-containing protein [Saprospiraceae bacterium]HMP25834.1 CHAT domain-containing protein [Saprospiraceae bacterium]
MRDIILSVGFIIVFIGVAKTQVSSDSLLILQLMDRALVLYDNNEKLDSAAIYLQKTRKIFLDSKEWNNYILFSLDVAQKLYRIRYYDEGIQYLQQTDQDIASVKTTNDAQRIELKYQMARGHYFLGNNDECIIIVENNLTKLDNTSSDYANHNNLLGATLRRKGLTLKAIDAYEKTLTIRKRALGARHDQVASILNNIGNAYVDLGLYSKALQSLNEALQIREEKLGSDHPNIATILLNLGTLFHFKGDENKAIQYYHRALAIFKASPAEYEVRIADIFNNLAFSYKNKGAFQESTAYHQQAIQKYQSLPKDYSVEIGNVYVNWSNLAALQKDHIKEVELAEKAIVLYKQTLEANHPRLVAAHNNLGIAYANTGDYEGAIAELKSLIPLIENDTEQREQFANLHNDIGDVYFKVGNFAEAKAYNERALTIQQELFDDKSYKLAYTYNSLAKIAEAAGRNEQALQYLQAALAANHAEFEIEYGNAAPPPWGFFKFDYFVESLLHKARLLRRSADAPALIQASLLYTVADSALTQVRDELLSADDKIRLSEKVFELSQAAIANYVQLAEATGDSRYLQEAFLFSEKSKSNVLSQSIQANQAKQFAGIPDSLIALEDQLQSDINFYNLKLVEQPDSTQRVLYQNERFAAQQAYRNLVEKLESEYPFYYQLKYDRTTPQVQALQFALPERTAMVSYFTGDSVLYSFVLTKEDFQVHRSPIGADFYEQQVGFRKSITNKLDADYVALAHNLYQILFPFILDRRVESLIIIPDGTLNKLPFEALLTKRFNPRGNINFTRLPYLLNNYQVNYALSATLYYQQEATMSALNVAGEGLLAYAPVFSKPQEVGLFANEFRNPIAAIESETSRTSILNGPYISALPATADEVRAIEQIFQQKGQKVSTYLFEDANEQQLKASNLQRSKYIHIATHGFINEAQPDLSGLLLFPTTKGREDHILYAGEVYNLNLSAELVVLSACETGLGKVASGEGLLGLSRAFRYAGANNLVVSLWKVQDRATADLMVRFYQQHLNGQAKGFSIPLRQAKLDLIRSETFSHPYFWSAFVLIGQ